MSAALLPARRCGLTASPRLYLLVGVSSIGGFLFGYDTGVVSGALLLIRATSGEGGLGGDSPLDHFEQETIVSSTIACCIVGSLCSGRASQQYGRKPVLITSCLIFTAGALLMAAAPSFLVLVCRSAWPLGSLSLSLSLTFSPTLALSLTLSLL